MTESEYIIATNRVKVSASITILRDVLPGDGEEYGIMKDDLAEIIEKLSSAERKLFSSIVVVESG